MTKKTRKLQKLISQQCQHNQSDKLFNYKDSKSKIFTNLTEIDIPEPVINTLILGNKFSYPVTQTEKPKLAIKIIKEFESSSYRIPPHIKTDLRHVLNGSLAEYVCKTRKKNNLETSILNNLKITKQFIKNRPEILFVNADKGGGIVAIGEFDYKLKMKAVFTEVKTYLPLGKSTINSFIRQLQQLIKKWKNANLIEYKVYNNIYPTTGKTARAYGLIKAHKEGYPVRPIISAIGTPQYASSVYIKNMLSQLLNLDKAHVITNSFVLAKQLAQMHIPDDHILISLDVISMFPSLPHSRILEALERKIPLCPEIVLPKEEIINYVLLVLNNMEFSFDEVTYRQCTGTPIGGCLSSLFSELVMRDLEADILSQYAPYYYGRYVDDLFLIVKKADTDRLLYLFNEYDPSIQFTLEVANNNKLCFLDLEIHLNNNKIYTNWYRKECSANRTLNFYSNHPTRHKISVINGLVDRAIKLSHPIFHSKNLILVQNILKENNYPMKFMNKYICKRMYQIKTNRPNLTTSEIMSVTEPSDNIQNIHIKLPYIPFITNKIKSMLAENQILMINTLANQKMLVKNHKDSISKYKKENTVYCIPCKDCNLKYVGQTKRELKTRLKEHQTNIKEHHTKWNSISKHRVELDHVMDFDSTKILDMEENKFARLISETLHIKLNTTMNSMIESNVFTTAYDYCLKLIKNLSHQ